jgi:16S rRNA (adenine1518-N6/adenine1519-N6)-dimethyltransferase
LSLPRKLGQHFLVQQSILAQLAGAICGEHTPRVIEIGPGRGALTRHLLPRTDELHAIELDTGLASFLQRQFAAEAKLRVHRADVLETDLSQWGDAAIAGNLPYYITSPIIRKFLELDEVFRTAVFLVQREVAERLLAAPGTRDYGYLTVMTQLVCGVELVCHVPAAAFSPPPKVESAAVRLTRKPVQPLDLPELLKFVARCFAQKRKTLRNNLRPFYGPTIDKMPEAGLRAEQLSVEQFKRLLVSLTTASFLEPPVH